jgi:hypothetical protein
VRLHTFLRVSCRMYIFTWLSSIDWCWMKASTQWAQHVCAGLGAVVALEKVVGLDVGGFDSLMGFEAVEVEGVGLQPDPSRGLVAADGTEVEVGLVRFVTLSAGFGINGSATADFASASVVVGVACASFVDESSPGFAVDVSVPLASAAGMSSPEGHSLVLICSNSAVLCKHSSSESEW